MSKLRCHISNSLDGYVAGPNQSKENPLGEGGERLHGWAADRLARSARWAGRRGEREYADHGGNARERRRRRQGSQHVRTGGRWGLGGGQWKGWWGTTRLTTTTCSSSPITRAIRK